MAVRSHFWADFAPRLRRHDLIDGIMERLGLDALVAISRGEGFIPARASCRNCHCVGACREWFLEVPEPAAEFHPNSGFFARLKGR
jgi:hypothetical protein